MSNKSSQSKNRATNSGANDAANGASNDAPNAPQLVRTPEGLALTDGTMTLRADFSRLLARANPAKVHQELLVKAVKIKGVSPDELLVVDATAGLGEDSFLLAAAGFNIVMFERDEVIAALLEDGLARAANDDRLAPITARMTLHKEDSIAALIAASNGANNRWRTTAASTTAPVAALARRNSNPGSAGMGTPFDDSAKRPTANNYTRQASPSQLTIDQLAPDVIVLDPMFPARTKSASVKKKFQLIHSLEAPCANEQELLDAAIGAHPRKIVIKRPPKGPWLASRKPAYSLEGKAVRYDCLVFER